MRMRDKLLEWLLNTRIVEWLLTHGIEFLLSMNDWYNWQLVRGIGQLQILNRASMFVLVFVPILAATWPIARRMLEPAFGVLDPMPDTCAILFYASLLLLMGRTIFQLFCPDVVKELSIDAYVQNKKQEHVKTPSRSAVDEARDYLRRLHRLQFGSSHLDPTDPDSPDDMAVIEEYARKIYLLDANRATLAMLLSVLFYFASICCIVYVIYKQTRAVYLATLP